MSLPTVLVTGCSEGGIGFDLAKAYANKGYHVFATARKIANMKGLESVKNVELFELDVSDIESVRAAAARVSQTTGGKLDLLVNNAGQSAMGPACEVDIELAKRAFDTNVFGVMRMCSEFIDLLIASKGTIANLGSITAYMPLAFGAAYNASKAALHQYADTLRLEMKPFGVNVVTVTTGTIKTKLWSYDPPLDPKSRYYIINDEYLAKRKGDVTANQGWEPSRYAEWFVKQTTKKNVPGWLYGGEYARKIYWLNFLLPRQSLLDATAGLYGIDVLQKRLAGEAKTK